jgi:hypothetical protein
MPGSSSAMVADVVIFMEAGGKKMPMEGAMGETTFEVEREIWD